MQKAEAFISDFLLARIIEERRLQAERAPFRRQFFTDDCRWDSRAGTLEMMESEKIISVDGTVPDPKVITTYNIPHAGGLRQSRLRYHLRPAADQWLIQCVDKECPACEGRGDVNCIYCKGKHWISTEPGRGQSLKEGDS